MVQVAADGVLLVAHGTVTDLDEMPAFLTAIRRGRAPSVELLTEMRRRYEAIGGSPLLTTTQAQARALEERLGFPVLVGMRFGRPSIEQAIQEAVRRSLERLLVLPMAPYSVNLYFQEVVARRAAMSELDRIDCPELLSVTAWGSHAGLVRAHAEQIRRFAEPVISSGAPLVLSAHSLPMRVLEAGDRYAIEVEASARAIGVALGRNVELAFQSQGADGGRWLGPDLKSVVDALAAHGQSRVVVAPIGFLCDHVETLYDLDIELKSFTLSLGIELLRVPALGTEPRFLDALAEIVRNSPLASHSDRNSSERAPC